MPYLAVIGTAFALTFLAELPDKSMFASLVLGTRYRPSWVWTGAAAAFAVHMALAVTAGRLLTLLPHRVVDAVVAGLFVFAGATLGLWAVAGAGVSVGAKSLDLIPMAWVGRITATIMLGLGVYTALAAVAG